MYMKNDRSANTAISSQKSSQSFELSKGIQRHFRVLILFLISSCLLISS